MARSSCRGKILGAAVLAASSIKVKAQIGGVDISHLPQCAQGCLAGNTGSASGCSISDIKCYCQSIPYINALSCCLQKQCSSSDQQAALTFDISLCNQYNVSIPDFLGCSPLSTTGSFSAGTFRATGSITSVSLAVVSTVANSGPVPTAPTAKAAASFSGDALLTGSCTAPYIASYTMANGAILQMPFVGCSNDDSSCCPYDAASPGPLTICPRDYITTSSACCPSGWSVYNTSIAGQMPCYTNPALPLVASATAAAINGIQPSVITQQLFTVRYPLVTPSTGLSPGAIAGIVIGAVSGLALFGILGAFVLRRRRQRVNARIQAATVSRPSSDLPTEYSTPKSPHTPRSAASHAHSVPAASTSMTHANMPSTAHYVSPNMPTTPDFAHTAPPGFVHATAVPGTPGSVHSFVAGGNPFAGPTMSSSRVDGYWDGTRTPPIKQHNGPTRTIATELPGSTFLHEHHPAVIHLTPSSALETTGHRSISGSEERLSLGSRDGR